jgi:hypothetical protein
VAPVIAFVATIATVALVAAGLRTSDEIDAQPLLGYAIATALVAVIAALVELRASPVRTTLGTALAALALLVGGVYLALVALLFIILITGGFTLS